MNKFLEIMSYGASGATLGASVGYFVNSAYNKEEIDSSYFLFQTIKNCSKKCFESLHYYEQLGQYYNCTINKFQVYMLPDDYPDKNGGYLNNRYKINYNQTCFSYSPLIFIAGGACIFGSLGLVYGAYRAFFNKSSIKKKQ